MQCQVKGSLQNKKIWHLSPAGDVEVRGGFVSWTHDWYVSDHYHYQCQVSDRYHKIIIIITIIKWSFLETWPGANWENDGQCEICQNRQIQPGPTLCGPIRLFRARTLEHWTNTIQSIHFLCLEKCAGCSKPLKEDGFFALGELYHKSCFRWYTILNWGKGDVLRIWFKT